MVVAFTAAAAVAVTVWAELPVPTTMVSPDTTALFNAFTCRVVPELDELRVVGMVLGTGVSALSYTAVADAAEAVRAVTVMVVALVLAAELAVAVTIWAVGPDPRKMESPTVTAAGSELTCSVV